MAALSVPTPEEVTVPLTIVAGDDLARGESETGLPVMISAQPPPGSVRTPSDICCVVDVSGSMGGEAMVATESGGTTGHGLSVLDIVKHALKTIIRTLEDGDRLALVSYSSEAKKVFGVTEMSEAGRRTTEEQLRELTPEGCTNLWAGLKMGVDILKEASAPGRLQHVMLFTDGMPNVNPPRGIKVMLERLKAKEGGKLPCTVSTFGFGYELDSELLSDIAILGSGTYAFIPDAGFVGTVFVNAMTNLLCTMGKDAILTVQPLGGARLAGSGALGGHPTAKAGDGIKIDLGCLQFGQSSDVLVNVSIPPGHEGDVLEAKLQYGTRVGPELLESSARWASVPPDSDAKLQAEVQRCRLCFVDAVRNAMKASKAAMKAAKLKGDAAAGEAGVLTDGQNLILEVIEELRRSPAASGNEFMAALIEDLTGQVSEAFSREDWYEKWGVHYLPSLMSAHLAQICNNFKDPGVQQYGGTLFEDLRDKADDIFCSLPAPEPSARPPPPPVAATPAVAAAPAPVREAAPVSMAAYYDRYAG
mmetsp:Transcript_94035/g.172410  ORF Transcript_94035/g.172410 Transcript_94035/m.172410 type:complete len:532 (-) Transcript_94035:239-1834(-)